MTITSRSSKFVNQSAWASDEPVRNSKCHSLASKAMASLVIKSLRLDGELIEAKSRSLLKFVLSRISSRAEIILSLAVSMTEKQAWPFHAHTAQPEVIVWRLGRSTPLEHGAYCQQELVAAVGMGL